MKKNIKLIFYLHRKLLITLFCLFCFLILFVNKNTTLDLKVIYLVTIISFVNTIFVFVYAIKSELPYWKNNIQLAYVKPLKMVSLSLIVFLLLFNFVLFFVVLIFDKELFYLIVPICIVCIIVIFSCYQFKFVTVFTGSPLTFSFIIIPFVFNLFSLIRKNNSEIIILFAFVTFLGLILVSFVFGKIFDYYKILYNKILQQGEIHNPILDYLFYISED